MNEKNWPEQAKTVLIETQWNVKTFGQNPKHQDQMRINRNIVECKDCMFGNTGSSWQY